MKRALVAGMFILCVAAGKAENKLAPDPLLRRDRSALEVIVQFNSAPTERRHNNIRRIGGELKRNLGAVSAARYSIPADRIAELSANLDVQRSWIKDRLIVYLHDCRSMVNPGSRKEQVICQ